MSSLAHDGRRSFKIPRDDNRYLCWPDASTSTLLLSQNATALSESRAPAWFDSLRTLARDQAHRAARDYLASYAPLQSKNWARTDPVSTKLILGGHQPELFHPGVWFKNFLLCNIASSTDARSLHVIIDHDMAKSDTLRVPELQDGRFHHRSIPLPIRTESEPRKTWQTTQPSNALNQFWGSAISNARDALATCGVEHSILEDRAELLRECLAKTKNISDAFSQFRHRIELDHGVCNAEVPMSLLCEQTSFGRFVFHCAQSARTLWETYNVCRNEYRTRNRVSNQAQPVPELQQFNGCIELPFWIYDLESVERGRLWIDNANGVVELCDAPRPEQRTISLRLPNNHLEFDSAFQEFIAEGYCIRPRALMTTLYLRCFIADLFVHGIGGGIYDELTDEIILRWLGLTPPSFITCSASLYLPIAIPATNRLTSRSSLIRERELMRSVPERFLDPTHPDHRELLHRHSEMLNAIPVRGKKKQWHREISDLKQQIESAIALKKRDLQSALEKQSHLAQQDKIVQSREYSLVLFPESNVVNRLEELAGYAIAADSSE